MASQRDKTKKRKDEIYDKYREILDLPDLSDKQIDQMRKNINLLARIVCEFVWEKRFY